MPAKTKKKAAKAKRKSGITRQAMPSFEPFVNRVAGPSASGVRVGFPAERTVSLNYCAYVPIDNASGVGANYQFRLNSAYDPNYTGAGSQPMGFDQWSLFYNHYVVESCDYQAVVTPNTASYVPMHYSVHISDDATVPNTIYEMTELGAQTAVQATGAPLHIFSGRVDMHKFFNRGGDLALDSELRAITTSSPSDMAFLTVRAQPIDGTSTVYNTLVLKLTMRVKFMEPKDLSPSMKMKDVAEDEYEFVRVKKVLVA